MIKRDLQNKIEDQLKKFPVIAITGPRQSGKTTLAKSVAPKFQYFNLVLNLNSKLEGPKLKN